MKNRNKVLGVRANAPRPTVAAAFLLATILSVPVFTVLSIIDWYVF